MADGKPSLEHGHPWAPTAPVIAPLPVLFLAPPPNPQSTPHPQPVLALQLAQFRSIPGKVRKKTAHLHILMCHVWKRNTREHAGQVRCVAGACLAVTIERGTVGSSWKPGPRWGPLASSLAPRVAMLLNRPHAAIWRQFGANPWRMFLAAPCFNSAWVH